MIPENTRPLIKRLAEVNFGSHVTLCAYSGHTMHGRIDEVDFVEQLVRLYVGNERGVLEKTTFELHQICGFTERGRFPNKG